MAQIPSTPPIALGDLIHPDTKRHTYAFYTHLRQQGPLTRLTNFFGSGDAWLVTHCGTSLSECLLTQVYGDNLIPADIQQYFQDPPMPPNLP